MKEIRPFHFETLEIISESDESIVSLIRKLDTDEYFLLKSLKTDPLQENPEISGKTMFNTEVSILSSLEHQNIVKLAGTFNDGNTFSLMYPYRRGKTLAQIFKEKIMFSTQDALYLIMQLLDALEYLHLRRLIHCDINPNNIFIDDEKGLTLLDFGMTLTEEDALKTPSGRVLGTMPYVSMEQTGFTDFKIDTRSDLFCTGLILYRLLSGSLPFEIKNNTIEELLDHLLKTEIQPLHNLSAILNAILLKALKATPADRYQTATGFKHDINLVLDTMSGKQADLSLIGHIDSIASVTKAHVFVGRENEIALLDKGLKAVINNKNVSYLISGRSGIGKSLLVHEFKKQVVSADILPISAHCNRFTAAQPYAALREMIQDFIEKISAETLPNIDHFKFVFNKELSEYSGIICDMFTEFGTYFHEVLPIDKVEPEKEAERLNHVLTRLLETILSFKRTILFIDDIQWIDFNSFDLFKNILQKQSVCMFIGTYRISSANDNDEIYLFGNSLQETGIKTAVALKSFTLDDIKEYILSLFGSVDDPDTLAEILLHKTDGTPFTLREAIRYLVNNSIMKKGPSGWQFSQTDILKLPDRFDSVSLILIKFNALSEAEKRYLAFASLIEGKFTNDIVIKLGDIDSQTSRVILNSLENQRFIIHHISGGYTFVHDKIKEAIINYIPKETKYTLYENLGQIYLEMIAVGNDYLFDAAECFLKSTNLSRSAEICYQAAEYAKIKLAFNAAIKYYKHTIFIVTQSYQVNIAIPIDLTKVKASLGDVFMLTGKNQEALQIFQELLKESDNFSENLILELKCKIGCIYHYMGEFENSIPCFIEALEKLDIKLPPKKVLVFFLVIEMIKQFSLSYIQRNLMPRKKDQRYYLITKILNLLCYSLYFDDMNMAYYAHFKALNIADRLEDSHEKVFAYSAHGFGIYQSLLKKRSLKYLNRSLEISNMISRKDSYGFAQYMNGAVYYFRANWKQCITHLQASISSFNSIGDSSSQPQCIEPIWKVYLMCGDLDKTEYQISKIIILCRQIKEKHFLITALSALYYVKLLRTCVENSNLTLEIDNILKQINSFLSNSEVAVSLIKAELLQNKLISAYERNKNILTHFKSKDFNSEYYVPLFSLYCEIITKELLYRKQDTPQLSISDKKLKKDFYKYSFIHWFSCLSYPAYWGAFYRNIAWFLALKNHKRLAGHFFKKSIKKHHLLDMRYEEARSIRDYGCFLDDCNMPGLARDELTKAYRLFEECGAKLETDRLRERVKLLPITTSTPPASVPGDHTSTSRLTYARQLRIDTLYEVTSSITELDDLDLLFQQVLNGMIKLTGAQYAWLFLESSQKDDKKHLCIDYQGKRKNIVDIPFSRNVVGKVKKEKKVLIIDDVSKEFEVDKERADTARITIIKSVLCAPLVRQDNYLGCVYLGNNVVSGLFTEESKKAVEILAAEAGVLIENAFLMDKYKQLNVHLEQKVNDQIKDIKEKNNQLSEVNLKLMELEQVRKLLTDTIVHDIKNYATGIEGNINILGRKFSDNQNLKRPFSLISCTCTDITNLTSNLLDISKMEESKLTVKKQLVSFEEIAGIVDQFKTHFMFEERNISISLLPPSEIFSMEADYYLLTRVLQNLFSNAAKYTPKDGQVAVSCFSNGTEDVICFFSSGTPIPDKIKNTIFDKYTRAEDGGSTYSKGLGLFFCKMVALAHQGRIWLDTDERGNYFKIAFKKSLVRQQVPSAT